MIDAIFLDAGGVIIDESHFESKTAEIITSLISEIKEYSIGKYNSDAEEAVYRFVSSVPEYIIFKNTDGLTQFNKILHEYKRQSRSGGISFKLMPGLVDLLKRLSIKYKFGILGQYGAELKQFLREQKILKYFTFTETQENYKMTKPDPRYFEAILGMAKCDPVKCVMVGDRIDKDIYPANVIGMRTIRLKTGLHIKQRPRIPIEMPAIEINSLEEITEKMLLDLFALDCKESPSLGR